MPTVAATSMTDSRVSESRRLDRWMRTMSIQAPTLRPVAFLTRRLR